MSGKYGGWEWQNHDGIGEGWENQHVTIHSNYSQPNPTVSINNRIFIYKKWRTDFTATK